MARPNALHQRTKFAAFWIWFCVFPGRRLLAMGFGAFPFSADTKFPFFGRVPWCFPRSRPLSKGIWCREAWDTRTKRTANPSSNRKQPPPMHCTRRRGLSCHLGAESNFTAPGAVTWRRTVATSLARWSAERGLVRRRGGGFLGVGVPSVGVVARFLRVWPPVPLGARRCVR